MKLIIKRSNIDLTSFNFFRSAGYIYIESRQTGQASFVRPFGQGHYPRFHIYIEEEGDTLTINLHLDQKKPSYKGTAAHSGEYDSPVVRAEINRLKNLLKTMSNQTFSRPNPRLSNSQDATKDPRSQRWSDMLRRM